MFPTKLHQMFSNSVSFPNLYLANMYITMKGRSSLNLLKLHQILADSKVLYRCIILYIMYVYNHKRKVKFKSGHAPPSFGRVMMKKSWNILVKCYIIIARMHLL